MVYNLLAILLFLMIILTVITIGVQVNVFIRTIRRGSFIKKLEKDTKDLCTDKFIDELEGMTNE